MPKKLKAINFSDNELAQLAEVTDSDLLDTWTSLQDKLPDQFANLLLAEIDDAELAE